jgi:hypothetical protein
MNHFDARTLRRCMGLVMLTPLVLASCNVTPKTVAGSMHNPSQERLEVIYRAYPSAGQLISSSTSSGRPAEVIQVAAEATNTTPFQTLNWSKAELRIICPHPDGRTDWARVSLHFRPVDCGEECAHISWSQQISERMCMRQSRRATYRERLFYEQSNPGPTDETFPEVDLPKEELDAILAVLNEHGFFSDPSRPSDAESQLEVRVNRRWTSKRWRYEPVLDALMTQVYEEGTVKSVSLQPPDESPQQPSRWAWLTPFGHSQ